MDVLEQRARNTARALRDLAVEWATLPPKERERLLRECKAHVDVVVTRLDELHTATQELVSAIRKLRRFSLVARVLKGGRG